MDTEEKAVEDKLNELVNERTIKAVNELMPHLVVGVNSTMELNGEAHITKREAIIARSIVGVLMKQIIAGAITNEEIDTLIKEVVG